MDGGSGGVGPAVGSVWEGKCLVSNGSGVGGVMFTESLLGLEQAATTYDSESFEPGADGGHVVSDQLLGKYELYCLVSDGTGD